MESAVVGVPGAAAVTREIPRAATPASSSLTSGGEAREHILWYKLRAIPEVVTDRISSPADEDSATEELLREQEAFVFGVGAIDLPFVWALRLLYAFQPGSESDSPGQVLLATKAAGPDSEAASRNCEVLSGTILSLWGPHYHWLSAEKASLPSPTLLLEVRRPIRAVNARYRIPISTRTGPDLYRRLLSAMANLRRPASVAIDLFPTRLSESDLAALRRLRRSLVEAQEKPDERLSYDPLAARTAILRTEELLASRGIFLQQHRVSGDDATDARLLANLLGAEICSGPRAEGGSVTAGHLVAAPKPGWEEASRHRFERIELDESYAGALQPDAAPDPNIAGMAWLSTLTDVAATFRLPVIVRRLGSPRGFPVENEPFPATATDGVPHAREVRLGHVLDRGEPTSIPFSVPLHGLTRNALVTGMIGSGKTTTLIRLATQLHENGIPFLILDPKTDIHSPYRQLFETVDDLHLFTLGNEDVSPFRFNPFAVGDGVRLESHKSILLDLIGESFPRHASFYALARHALDDIYRDHALAVTKKDPSAWPTMLDFADAFDRSLRAMSFKRQENEDWLTLVRERFYPFVEGALGRMLNGRSLLLFPDIMSRPTIMEFHMGRVERSLVLMFILAAIADHFQRQGLAGPDQPLRHVTLIDEINVLIEAPERVDPELEGNPGAELVRLLNRLTATMRAFGEGIVVAGQTASRLSEEVIGNTLLKIIHQQGGDLGKHLSASLALTATQADRLRHLRPGEAIALEQSGGRRSLGHVAISNRGLPDGKLMLGDEEIGARMRERLRRPDLRQPRPPYAKLMGAAPFVACMWCRAAESGLCLREATVARLDPARSQERARRIGDACDPARPIAWPSVTAACREVCCELDIVEPAVAEDVCYCYLVVISPRRSQPERGTLRFLRDASSRRLPRDAREET